MNDSTAVVAWTQNNSVVCAGGKYYISIHPSSEERKKQREFLVDALGKISQQATGCWFRKSSETTTEAEAEAKKRTQRKTACLLSLHRNNYWLVATS